MSADNLDTLCRAAAHNGRLQGFIDAVTIIKTVADNGGDKRTCLRIVNLLDAHHDRVAAGIETEWAIARAAG